MGVPSVAFFSVGTQLQDWFNNIPTKSRTHRLLSVIFLPFTISFHSLFHFSDDNIKIRTCQACRLGMALLCTHHFNLSTKASHLRLSFNWSLQLLVLFFWILYSQNLHKISVGFNFRTASLCFFYQESLHFFFRHWFTTHFLPPPFVGDIIS